MKLMIIESPNKKDKLAEILGQGWSIAASYGHVRDLPTKELGVDVPEFRARYEVTEKGARALAGIQRLLRDADEVYLATDPDREGESISWHLQQCLKLNNAKRITFNAISADAVLKALKNPRRIDTMRVAAQEARRILDRLVGYLVSPRLSTEAGQRLSAGRVQTPAVRLVVDREREIKAFRQTTHFGAAVYFVSEGLEWRADWTTSPDFTSDDSPYFLDRDFAGRVSELRDFEVVSFAEGEVKRKPPAPFTTSTLQQAASVALGMDPKATMEIAQELFAHGHISYHRTDNPNIDPSSIAQIHAVASSMQLDMAEELPRMFKAKEGAQEGHPAITPTHWDIEDAGTSEAARAIYHLVRIRAIASQLADAIYAVRTVVLRSELDGKPIVFEAKGRTLVYSGWLRLLTGDQTCEDEDPEPTNPIPVLQPEQGVAAERGELLEKKTKPPSRYTCASLVAKLEASGIGRPATYAAILDNILARDYVRVERKQLIPTATGELICDALVGKFAFVELGFTRAVEHDLDRIADGEIGYLDVLQRVHEQLDAELSTLTVDATPQHPCPECGKALRRIRGKGGYFWGCSGFPDCNTTLADVRGKPVPRPPLSSFACAKCAKPLIHRQKGGRNGYDFWGCSGYPHCTATFPNQKGVPRLEQHA